MKVRKREAIPDPIRSRKPKEFRLGGNCGYWMSIDPGVGGTGFAVWSAEDFDSLSPPIDSGSIECDDSSAAWIERAARIGDLLRTTVCRKYPLCHVFYEHPAFLEGPKGIASARDGSLVKLSIIAGIVVASTAVPTCTRVTPVPLHWKGQMSKTMTEKRIRERIPDYRARDGADHEWDAIGIGLFVKGYFG